MSWVSTILGWDLPTILAAAGILVSIVIAAVTLHMAFSIARKQDDQLKNLDIQKTKHENVQQFFNLDNRSPMLTCMYPDQQSSRPFHTINYGDHSALHILVDLIGAPHLKLSPVFHSKPYLIPPDTPILFLCSPSTNKALGEILPPLVFEKVEPSERQRNVGLAMTNYTVKLPCWFAHEKGSDQYPPIPEFPYLKMIWIRQPHEHIVSDAEPEYREAARLGTDYEPTVDVLQDAAILLRSHHDGQRIFALAGIHQYGTVIAAKFLHQLVHEKIKSKYHDFLFSQDDFVAVIKGGYDVTKLDATSYDIITTYFWTRPPKSNQQWKRQE